MRGAQMSLTLHSRIKINDQRKSKILTQGVVTVSWKARKCTAAEHSTQIPVVISL